MTALVVRAKKLGRARIVPLLLAGTCLSPLSALAQSATWLASPANNNYFNASNWTPATVPLFAGTASFGASTVTNVVFASIGANLPVFQFNPGAPAYTFIVPSGGPGSGFFLDGIVNNSSNTPTFTLLGGLGYGAPSLSLSPLNAIINIASTGSFFLGGTLGNATINNAGTMGTVAGSSLGNATIITASGGMTQLTDTNMANATVVTQSGGQTLLTNSTTGPNARVITNAGGTFGLGFLTTGATSIGSIEGAGNYNLNGNQLTTGSNNLSTTVDGVISGAGGSLVKVGTGTLILTGANTYSGGTTVLGGILQGNTTSLQGSIVNNATVVFDQATNGSYGGVMSGTGTLFKQNGGVLTLTGANTFTGGTAVTGGGLVVNGSLASGVVVGQGAALGGTGSITGAVVNQGTLSPGSSTIGTLTVNGSYAQNGGTYQVEVSGTGQSDMLRVAGAGGTATLNGGQVTITGLPGGFSRSTTYTIVNTTGGLSGSFSSVSENFAFLSAKLSYDANNAYLTLFQGPNEFQNGGQTFDERAVGNALDRSAASASGDFATVLQALDALTNGQGPAALEALSGQPYTDFGTMNVGAGFMFLNTLGNQMMGIRTGSSAAAQRVALAEACGEACDGADPRLGAWVSGMASLGSVEGNGNSSTFTYNLAGAAAGIDYRIDPRFLLGFAVGYSGGRSWVDSFLGNGTTDNYSAALYASFTQAGFYLDAAAGYTYSDNQLTRPIVIPGLATRNASGRTGANQFIGQAEAGYRVGIYEPAHAALTPFARFQIAAVSQNAFGESGAGGISLNVAQQNTTSTRTVLGADLSGAIPLGGDRTLDTTLRLGWSHDYADTARPVTASFAGAPGVAFTVYGAQPQRDAAVIGFGANTKIAEATSIYARYDGEIASRDSTHAFTAGFRMTW